jgi:endonuclease YncB( thermonuclease family)
MGVSHNLALATLRRRGGALTVAGTILGLGMAIGTLARPAVTPHRLASNDRVVAAAHENAAHENTVRSAAPLRRFDLRLAHSVEVVRVIDGDTFAARIDLWPGLSIDTKVRLRDIDAPELHARCADEYVKARAARAALATILAEGDITISRVGADKYGGRVDAAVSTRNTPDVSAALRGGGWARSYNGGRRRGWC